MTPQEARKELARRELARRQSTQTPAQPQKNSKAFSVGAGIAGGLRGATLGASDHIEAGLSSAFPSNFMAGGADVRFGDFDGNLQKIRDRNDGVEKQAPVASGIGKVSGAILGAGKLAAAGKLPSQAIKGRGLLATTAGAAADGAAFAGAESLLSGDSLGEAAGSGAVGAGIGGILNGVTRGAGKALAPIAAPVAARLNPQGAATDFLRKRLERSGQSIEDITAKFRSASNDGNNQLTVADALGNEGQRALSGIARTPGADRNRIAEFLNNRQQGQADRISQDISGGFTNGETAKQAIERLKNVRRTTDNANFGAIPDQPISLEGTQSAIENALKSSGGGVKLTKAERAVRNVRDQLFGSNGSSVSSDRVAEIRRSVGGDVDKQFAGGNTDIATKLNKIKKALTNDTDKIPDFREANKISSTNASIRDAVLDGQAATAPSARIEDVLQQFKGLTPSEQSSFKIGVGDKLLGKVEGPRVNKASLFKGDKVQGLLGLSDDGDRIARNIDRENLFFETRNTALGGSQTANNQLDQADVSGFASAAVRGDLISVIGSLATRGAQAFQGQTPEVRKRIADALLAQSPDEATKAIARSIQRGEKLTQNQTNAIRALTVGGITLGSQ